MITVAEAKQLLNQAVQPLVRTSIRLIDAHGYILAKDIFASADSPRFDQSAVDGYAVLDTDSFLGEFREYVIQGELKAGSSPVIRPRTCSAYRIFTGAPVPKGAYCVVMQEHTQVNGGIVSIPVTHLRGNANIRRRGNHFLKGDLILTKGQFLDAPSIGLLASQGSPEVQVYPKPRITVIVTGDELVLPGTKAPLGSVYESNSFMLNAALQQNGFSFPVIKRAPDKAFKLENLLSRSLEDSDTLIITGGISVGKYDLVRATLDKLGVKEVFHKVSQKPGKPLYAGMKGKKLVFGLPGNPAAVMVCYLQYVLPSIRMQSGWSDVFFNPLRYPLAHVLQVKGDRDQFLRAKISGDKVIVQASQDSDNLHSFATANALVHIPSGIKSLVAGELVDVFPFK